jgi:hypothetical protein
MKRGEPWPGGPEASAGDLLQACSQRGEDCGADLGDMGVWPDDGTPVLPAIATDSPT